MKKIKNILVINVNWIGDVVFSSPLFPVLKEAYPNVCICCLAPSRVKDILESIPSIDEILIYDEKGKHKSITSKIKLIFQLRKYHFDIAFLLHGSLTRALLVYWAGIPQRVGYPTKGRRKYLTHAIEPIPDLHTMHRSDFYLNIIESFGIPIKDRATCLTVSEQAIEEMNNLLRQHELTNRDFLVAINPGGNWDLKRWPPQRFSLLIERLVKEFDAKIVITGAIKDVSLSKKIVDHLESNIINLTGKLTLKQLIAIFKKMDIVVSADSGPIHLASSIGTQVVGIFGPTKEEITGPRGKGKLHILKYDVGCNRQACYHLKCKANICMQAVTVEDVVREIAKIKKK